MPKKSKADKLKAAQKSFNIKQLQSQLNRLQELYFVATKAKKIDQAEKYALESNSLIKLLKRYKFKVTSKDGKWRVSI
mgnify:CR=1 FL=1|jgi:hypothetical protein